MGGVPGGGETLWGGAKGRGPQGRLWGKGRPHSRWGCKRLSMWGVAPSFRGKSCFLSGAGLRGMFPHHTHWGAALAEGREMLWAFPILRGRAGRKGRKM